MVDWGPITFHYVPWLLLCQYDLILDNYFYLVNIQQSLQSCSQLNNKMCSACSHIKLVVGVKNVPNVVVK